jgi:signal transduction histidine kinase
MRFSELRRTTTFRLTILYGALFAAGTLALLWMIYVRSVMYMTARVDRIIDIQADALLHSPRPGLRQRLIEDLTLNGDRMVIFGLFNSDGGRLAGNLPSLPTELHLNEQPIEVPPTSDFPSSARLMARALPTGEVLVVGRDVSQLEEMRSITRSALIWSGVVIIIAVLVCGTVLSIRPMQRIHRLRAVAQDIAHGDLQRRMPTTSRQDELDMLAETLNSMMGEVERLMSEVQSATAVIAHDLLSPLASVTQQLRRLQATEVVDRADIARITERIEDVLERFRAILRLAELEAGQRRAGFKQVDLAQLAESVTQLYAPLAEEAGVRLLAVGERGVVAQGDRELLFEALTNLVDNAVKFSHQGGTVQVRVGKDSTRPQLIVEDNGPGIPAEERAAVLQRFYRVERGHPVPGSGLGLSVVAAIIRLHDFDLLIEDAAPGVRATIDCRTSEVRAVSQSLSSR